MPFYTLSVQSCEPVGAGGFAGAGQSSEKPQRQSDTDQIRPGSTSFIIQYYAQYFKEHFGYHKIFQMMNQTKEPLEFFFLAEPRGLDYMHVSHFHHPHPLLRASQTPAFKTTDLIKFPYLFCPIKLRRS